MKQWIAIVHAIEEQATCPTGNRATGNRSYRQPSGFHKESSVAIPLEYLGESLLSATSIP